MGGDLRLALDAASSGDLSALYTAAGSVLVALIGGAFALRSSRREPPPEPPQVRYIDPPTSHSLPQELTELYTEERDRLTAEIQRLTRSTELWMQRAYDAGWRQQ